MTTKAPDTEPTNPQTPTPDEELVASLPGYSTPTMTGPGPEPLSRSMPDDLDDEPVTLLPPQERTSSRASTRSGFPRAREVLERLVSVVGRVAHSRLAPGPEQDLWLADEQDFAEIAGPLASIVDRHAKIGDGTAANDVVDGVLAAVGVVGYLEKNLRRQAEMVQWLQQQQQNADVHG